MNSAARQTPGTHTMVPALSMTGHAARALRAIRTSCMQRTTSLLPCPPRGRIRSPARQGRTTYDPSANQLTCSVRAISAGAGSRRHATLPVGAH